MTSAARAFLLALGTLAASTAHAAEPPMLRGTFGGPAEAPPADSGVYVGVRGGWSWMRGTEAQVGNVPISDTSTFTPGVFDGFGGLLVEPFTTRVIRNFDARYGQTYDGAANFSGFAGYDFGTFLEGFSARMEAEAGRFSHSVNTQIVRGIDRTTTTFTSPSTTSTNIVEVPTSTSYTGGDRSGRTTVTYALANYYVDWNLGRIRPYVGAGIGVGYVEMRDFGVLGTVALSDANWGWAYQFGAGVSFDLMPNVALEAGYRQLSVRDVSMTSRAGYTDKVAITSQQANVGVRVRF